MTLRLRQFISSTHITQAATILSFLLGISLLFQGARDLGIVFLGYGLVLINSRIYYGRYIHGFWGASTIVRILCSAVFFAPLLILSTPPLRLGMWSTLASISFGLALVLYQLPDLKFSLSKEFIAILPPLTNQEKFNDLFHPLLGAIAQEYFYRGVMLSVCISYIGIWAIIPATLFFTFEHYTHFNAHEAFDIRDYVLQTILGLGLGVIFYFSQSLLACMVGHIIYNFPSVLQTMRRVTNPSQEPSEALHSSEVVQ